MVCQVGASIPAHCTSQGKVHLAYSPRETTRRVINRVGMQRFTPHTLCTAESLLKELEKVRSRGYAIGDAEHEKNIRGIAVPIFDGTGRLKAMPLVKLYVSCQSGLEKEQAHQKFAEESLGRPLVSQVVPEEED